MVICYQLVQRMQPLFASSLWPVLPLDPHSLMGETWSGCLPQLEGIVVLLLYSFIHSFPCLFFFFFLVVWFLPVELYHLVVVSDLECTLIVNSASDLSFWKLLRSRSWLWKHWVFHFVANMGVGWVAIHALFLLHVLEWVFDCCYWSSNGGF